ncbi:MAG: HEAT repeat domain-containing protein, partial [Bryobacterales bacterium]|nr:HEAT repeat domain-containing protein [Bryobacterales bacterium]
MHCCPLTRQVLSAALKISIIAALAGGLYLMRGAAARPAGRVELQSGKFTREFRVEAGKYYQFLASAPHLAALGQDTSIELTLTGPGGETLRKPLHAGDPDLYLTLAPTQAGAVQVVAEPKGGAAAAQDLDVQLEPIGAVNATAQLGSAFHTSWESAEAIELGRPVYAANDDRPYIPKLAPAAETFGQMLAGIHWYKLDYRGPGDRLVHFNVDIQDRDVPAGIEIFTLRDGKPVEYTRGRERYETEKSTNFHGLSKFAPRVISPGVYYVRVMANHPFYKLETDHYPPPPYSDPRLAVRAAMDYIVRRGDAWHANVPRKGAVALRNSNPLQETRLCIACHPTHFSTRGELFAMRAGYPVRARSSLQFLTERLANNPRPLYGKPDASWARMIHAPGNVLSRVAYLTNQYEQLVTGERRTELYRGIAGFLEMYWPQVTQPQMESNGNLPRISGFEVALHSAMLFADLAKRTGEPRYQTLVDQIERVIAGGEVVDNLDLCWKIDALVWLNERAGNNRYRTQIDDLARRLLSYQQADGRWALPFGLEEVQYDFRLQKTVVKKIPKLAGQEGPRAADFQTWHAIYALARAGVTLADPRLKKAVDVCLSRQTPSGAWQGNPDYKNFDTPFRDTQYALMALTTLYPGPLQKQVMARQRFGWNAGFPAPPSAFATGNAAATVVALDQHWDRPSPTTARKIRQLLDSPHVLVRYQAAVTLGRFADPEAISALATRLGDPSKLVQRGAAWALRNIASRRPESRAQALAAIERSLDSTDDRTRWGALRVLNQHFKYVSEEWTLGERVLKIARQDPVA